MILITGLATSRPLRNSAPHLGWGLFYYPRSYKFQILIAERDIEIQNVQLNDQGYYIAQLIYPTAIQYYVTYLQVNFLPGEYKCYLLECHPPTPLYKQNQSLLFCLVQSRILPWRYTILVYNNNKNLLHPWDILHYETEYWYWSSIGTPHG